MGWKSSRCASAPIFGRWFSPRAAVRLAGVHATSAQHSSILRHGPLTAISIMRSPVSSTARSWRGRSACRIAFNTDGRTELAEWGWDQVIRWAHDDRMTGRAQMALSALEISMLPKSAGQRPFAGAARCQKACARTKGFGELFGRCDQAKSTCSQACRCATMSTPCAPMAFRRRLVEDHLRSVDNS